MEDIMSKYIVGFLSLFLVLFLNCKDVLVYYPIPLTFKVEISGIQTDGGSYSGSGSLSATEIYDNNIKQQLSDAGLSTEDIENVELEGVAFTISKPTDQSAILDTAAIRIGYNGRGPDMLLNMANVNFGQVLNKPQALDLSPGGVDLLTQALKNIVLSGGLGGDVLVKVSGSLTSGEVTFDLLIEMTVTTVVKKKQQVFEPF